jgi:hypothetical protein
MWKEQEKVKSETVAILHSLPESQDALDPVPKSPQEASL